jgi:hypothetical protein
VKEETSIETILQQQQMYPKIIIIYSSIYDVTQSNERKAKPFNHYQVSRKEKNSLERQRNISADIGRIVWEKNYNSREQSC